jgi:NAD(P)H-hydrate repair Nnr-like enzyme with NAD(P)H-hydrate dehydratase domain
MALKKATDLNCFIILKGHHTFIACPDGKGFYNTTGNAGMATAGSGDVLTGILTGLLSQGYSPLNTCLLGTYIHGLAGDIAAKKLSEEAMLSGDIIENLGAAFELIHDSK